MKLGVMTHFAHGWNPVYIDQMKADGIIRLRDEIQWRAVETTPGTYVQTQRNIDWMAKARTNAVDPLIILGLNNPVIEGGDTPYTPAGIASFANYAVQTIATFPTSQIKAVEVWNEYNGGTFVSGPATADKPFYYVELLKAAYTAVKTAYPTVKVIAGGTILIPEPYIRRLCELGAWDYMDGFSVHAYRPDPEGVKEDIEAVRAILTEFGGAKPIYVTEFGKKIDGVEYTPAYLSKMAVLMAAAKVDTAYWYLLKDISGFTGWGLYDSVMQPKPLLAAWKHLQTKLPNSSVPTRKNTFGHRTHVWWLSYGSYLVWSRETRPVTWGTGTTLTDATGASISLPTEIGTEAVFMSGTILPSFGTGKLVFDTNIDFGQPFMSYFSRTSTGTYTALTPQPTPGLYNDHLGVPGDTYLSVTEYAMHPGGGGKDAVARFTAPAAESGTLTGEFNVPSSSSNGAVAWIRLNGAVIFTQVATQGNPVLLNMPLTVAAGDMLEVGVGSNGSNSFDHTEVAVRFERS